MAPRRHSWSLAHHGHSPSTGPVSGVLSQCLLHRISIGWKPVLGKLLASPHRNQCFLSLSHWSEEQMESPPTTRGRQGCRFGVMGEFSGVVSRYCFLITVGMFSSYYSLSPSCSASIWTSSDKHQYLCKFSRLTASPAQGLLCWNSRCVIRQGNTFSVH